MTIRGSVWETPADVRKAPLSPWFPGFFFAPSDGMSIATSALGDYDQPEI